MGVAQERKEVDNQLDRDTFTRCVAAVVEALLYEAQAGSRCFDDDRDYATIVDTFAGALSHVDPEFDDDAFFAACGADEADVYGAQPDD
jgi:hypothetical protein